MTPLEFLESKGVQDLSEPFSASTIELFLDEYSEKILIIAAEKAKLTTYQKENYMDFSRKMVDKESILNCLKDKA